MKKISCGLLLLCVFNSTVFAGYAEEEAAEVQRYIEVLQGPSIQLHRDACNELQWKGVTDERLYDLIQAKLEAILASPDIERSGEKVETAAWYAKGLGSSGMGKYLPTLQKMAGMKNRKLQRYANEGIEKIGQYKKWNPIISNKKNFQVAEPLQDNRFANMLRSDDWELKTIATKRIHYEHLYNEYLLDILRDELLESYQAADTTPARVDGYKWMVKALAGSRNRKYYDSLKEVESNMKHRKLRAYVAKAIKGYYK